ncbi:MAG: YdcF family protein [Timaviella obliquedivisa GSE-PSE-MK23-08B]|nr:YdcF family protein [Timaviella obliquedivisa GSE-PSE-MK23-08B]
MRSQSSISLLRRSRTRSRIRPVRFLLKWTLMIFLLGVAYQWLAGVFLQPQAILVLGGASEREFFAAEFAKEHPNLPIWVSSGSNPEYSEWVFSEAGIPADRLHLDYQAVDTVTNFTTLVREFKSQEINSIYLITSDYHMRRASVIGEIVLGSQGIDFKPVVVASKQSPESLNKAIRDGARAVLWVTTGQTGDNLAHLLNKEPN